MLFLSIPSPNLLWKSQAPLYSSYDGRLAQITITSCSESVYSRLLSLRCSGPLSVEADALSGWVEHVSLVAAMSIDS